MNPKELAKYVAFVPYRTCCYLVKGEMEIEGKEISVISGKFELISGFVIRDLVGRLKIDGKYIIRGNGEVVVSY